MTASFFERLRDRIDRVDSVVSVGLDADPDRIPEHLREKDLPRWAFNRRIIDATHEHAAAYKPNAAFYEDADGWRALRETVAYAHGKDVPVVVDAKRGDIGNTARAYAGLLDDDGLGADAVTVNPYMGRDSVEPFLGRDGKAAFVLCRTSNPGGADLQDLTLAGGDPVYRRVAELAEGWNDRGDVGLVVGATAPDELEALREATPRLPFLVPGVGAQGGDAEAAVEHGLAGLDGGGRSADGAESGVGLVNSSRGIIFAGEGESFDRAAGQAAKRLKRRLNGYR